MKPLLFLVVADSHFYPGALATVASIIRFHPEGSIIVINNCVYQMGLSDRQSRSLELLGAVVLDGRIIAGDSRKSGAWELKAYAADHFSDRAEILIGIDADCLLCGPVHDVVTKCLGTGSFFGGQDGSGIHFDIGYEVYGFDVPAWSEKYMSTSLYFCKTIRPNRDVLREWADCCSSSIFGNTGLHPGHGDQGVLNAILYKNRDKSQIELLNNQLWSQHWVYWDSPLTIREGRLFNMGCQEFQRSIHAGGTEKLWTLAHRRKLDSFPHICTNYSWFLHCLEYGWERASVDPRDVLDNSSIHLIEDATIFREKRFIG